MKNFPEGEHSTATTTDPSPSPSPSTTHAASSTPSPTSTSTSTSLHWPRPASPPSALPLPDTPRTPGSSSSSSSSSFPSVFTTPSMSTPSTPSLCPSSSSHPSLMRPRSAPERERDPEPEPAPAFFCRPSVYRTTPCAHGHPLLTPTTKDPTHVAPSHAARRPGDRDPFTLTHTTPNTNSTTVTTAPKDPTTEVTFRRQVGGMTFNLAVTLTLLLSVGVFLLALVLPSGWLTFWELGADGRWLRVRQGLWRSCKEVGEGGGESCGAISPSPGDSLAAQVLFVLSLGLYFPGVWITCSPVSRRRFQTRSIAVSTASRVLGGLLGLCGCINFKDEQSNIELEPGKRNANLGEAWYIVTACHVIIVVITLVQYFHHFVLPLLCPAHCEATNNDDDDDGDSDGTGYGFGRLLSSAATSQRRSLSGAISLRTASSAINDVQPSSSAVSDVQPPSCAVNNDVQDSSSAVDDVPQLSSSAVKDPRSLSSGANEPQPSQGADRDPSSPSAGAGCDLDYDVDLALASPPGPGTGTDDDGDQSSSVFGTIRSSSRGAGRPLSTGGEADRSSSGSSADRLLPSRVRGLQQLSSYGAVSRTAWTSRGESSTSSTDNSTDFERMETSYI
ncbi:uncharacterized protein LOC143277099 [Babylonia areolata]|uniref:uncharacterized protein LOC143277099 n=1 Tax=Babylonia areolata TaxID=304850 RepID=UPI003FD49D8D